MVNQIETLDPNLAETLELIFFDRDRQPVGLAPEDSPLLL